MNDWLDRTRLLLGEEKLARLERAHVLVVGLGGVGAYAAEQLCRAGIGEMTVIDGDVVEPTNKNRQLLALDGNMGLPKAEVMASRLRSINPALRLHVLDEFVRDDRMLSILRAAAYDYVVDAIDTLAPKIFLIYHSLQLGLPVVSSMGSGGKLDPSKIQVADISKTPKPQTLRRSSSMRGKTKNPTSAPSPICLPSSDAMPPPSSSATSWKIASLNKINYICRYDELRRYFIYSGFSLRRP